MHIESNNNNQKQDSISKIQTNKLDSNLSPSSNNNNRIAKNAFMLYVRMIVALFIGLYTSRVMLDILGDGDYGLYNVVGGVVAFLTFINGAMAGATSRFLAFEIGVGDQEKLKRTFSSALIVHILLAVLFVIVVESAGLWFLSTKLVIPTDRYNAALIVFHLSVVSSFFGFLLIPFSASTIAHEKMDAYAYIEILNVILKLCAVVLLQLVKDIDKLILVSLLFLVKDIVIFILYFSYCHSRFIEVRIRFIWDKKILKPLISFSGFSFFSSFAVTAKQQGITFLINIFFGVVVNAANAIVTSVTAIVTMVSESVCAAARPQVIKMYASKRLSEMASILNMAISISMPITICVTAIIIFNRNFILGLWLVSVPKYTDLFLTFMLIENTFSLLRININMAIIATGKIKWLSFLYSANLILVIPIAYFVLKFWSQSPIIIYVFSAISGIVGVLISVLLLRKLIQEFPMIELFKEITKVLFTIFVVVLLLLFLNYFNFGEIKQFFLSSSFIVILVIIMTYVQLSTSNRTLVKSKIIQLFNKGRF